MTRHQLLTVFLNNLLGLLLQPSGVRVLGIIVLLEGSMSPELQLPH